MRNIPEATKNLLIINILFFIATKLNSDFMFETFSLFYPTSQHFHIWQPVTYMFMHGGFFHIFLNMFSLVMFGSMLERMLGTRKFLVFYFVCGLGAMAIHLGVEALQASAYMDRIADGSQQAMAAYQVLKNTPTVGASGAVYGLLIGYAILFPDARLTLIFPPITMKSRTWVLIFVALELLQGLTGTGSDIAHFAHLGGMLFGWILITYWRKRGKLFSSNGFYY